MKTRNILALVLAAALFTPLAIAPPAAAGPPTSWRTADRSSAGIAPDPAITREAVIQAFAARLWGKRGTLAVHSWLIAKKEGARSFRRYDLIGWRGGRVTTNGYVADGKWYGQVPQLLLDIRGPRAAALIPKIEAAVAAYPYDGDYTLWPGPNSNSFIAAIGRAVPELRLPMSPLAIGKDYLGGAKIFGPTPSGTGFQFSLFGALGIGAGLVEGLEVNVLGLVFGIDFHRPALKLPGIGRLGMPLRRTAPAQ